MPYPMCINYQEIHLKVSIKITVVNNKKMKLFICRRSVKSNSLKMHGTALFHSGPISEQLEII